MLFQLKYAKTRAHINQEDGDVPYPSTIRLSNPGSFDLQLHVKNKACPLSVWHVGCCIPRLCSNKTFHLPTNTHIRMYLWRDRGQIDPDMVASS